jgi:hypothetical protein
MEEEASMSIFGPAVPNGTNTVLRFFVLTTLRALGQSPLELRSQRSQRGLVGRQIIYIARLAGGPMEIKEFEPVRSRPTYDLSLRAALWVTMIAGLGYENNLLGLIHL